LSRAGARHSMCELKHGVARVWHAMCKSAFSDHTCGTLCAEVVFELVSIVRFVC